MCNAASRLAAAAMLVMGALASCGDSNTQDPAAAEKAAADSLVARITTLLDHGQPDEALALIDTISARYPQQIDARREALNMRPRVIEAVTVAKIPAADSLIAVTQLRIDSIYALLKHIPSANGLEGYYVVAKAYNPNFIETNGLEARINDADRLFYIVAQDNAAIGLNQVALFTADEQCSSQAIPEGSARAFTEGGWEMASLLPEDVDELGAWAYDHPGIKGAMLLGTKGNKKVNLTPQQAQSFGLAWQYANQRQILLKALIVREELERQLQIARDQMANTIAPE